MNNTKNINPEDFILVGGGRWGESFNHRENPDIMLKLYAPEQKQMALDEYDRAQKFHYRPHDTLRSNSVPSRFIRPRNED